MRRANSNVRIAIAQSPGTRLDQWRETRALIQELIRQAAGQQAQLVVLPECVWPAYAIGSRQAYDDARAAGLPPPSEFLAEISQTARDLALRVCVGYIEEHAGRLYNTAALFGPDGVLCGTHRKCFLWAFDHDYFTPGECVAPVATDFGRAGLMVCADARRPGIPAALAARGIDLLLQPTAWVNAGTPTAPWNPQPDFLIRSRAAEFGVPCASASKWGLEGDTLFVGSSLICDARGEIVVQCGQTETCVVTAEVELQRARPPVITEAERSIFRSSQVPTVTAPQGPLRLVGIADDAADHAITRALQSERGAFACPIGIRRSDIQGARGFLLCDAQRGLEFVPRGVTTGQAGVRVVGVAAAETERYPVLRRHALSGVHAALVFGATGQRLHLQARACENRVFVVHVTSATWRVFDPTGQMLLERAPQPHRNGFPTVEVDVSLAAEKEVVRGTHVLVRLRGTTLD